MPSVASSTLTVSPIPGLHDSTPFLKLSAFGHPHRAQGIAYYCTSNLGCSHRKYSLQPVLCSLMVQSLHICKPSSLFWATVMAPTLQLFTHSPNLMSPLNTSRKQTMRMENFHFLYWPSLHFVLFLPQKVAMLLYYIFDLSCFIMFISLLCFYSFPLGKFTILYYSLN